MTYSSFSAKEHRIKQFINKGVEGSEYNGHTTFDVLPKMNRAELKRMKKAEEEKVTMTKAELEKYVQNRLDKEHAKMLLSTARFICVLWCMQLHDYNGFGTKRLMNITGKVDELMQTINLDYVKWEELRDQLAEETEFFINLSGE